MTLIVAIGCSDGVVIAADSAASDSEAGTKETISTKIRQVRDFPIAFGGAGDAGLLQKIYRAIQSLDKPEDLEDYRLAVKRVVSPIQREALDLHVPHPAYGGPPVAVMLLAGVMNGKSWILEIDGDATDTIYDETYGNFAAIGGIGKTFAHVYFRPHLLTERNCALGQIFAYRLVDDSIRIAVSGLGEPIHVHTIKNDDHYHELTSEEKKHLSITCELWRELERETVGKLLSPPDGTSEPPEIPAPPTPY